MRWVSHQRENGARLFLFFLYALLLTFLLSKENFVTADLGRHLKNGEVLFQNLSAGMGLREAIPHTNLYSYTNPQFPFLNHHWASGVIFFLIHRLGGFPLLSLVAVGISLVSLFFMVELARRSSNLTITLLVSILILPLLASRTEIRPELFSYLFCTFFLWVLWNWRHGTGASGVLAILPVVEILWVNLHIYFFMGILLVGVFWLGAWVDARENPEARPKLKFLGLTFGATLASTILNPFGIRGALYPFRILQNYGYPVLENQSVWFLESHISYPPLPYFKLVFAVLGLSWLGILILCYRKKEKISLAYFFLSIFLSIAAWRAVRNLALFGYLTLPIIAHNLSRVYQWWMPRSTNPVLSRPPQSYFLLAGGSLLALSLLFLINPNVGQGRIRWNLGPAKGYEDAIAFFKTHGLRGPIFNNYDNGSYLIYYLYPRERVFVDNRPEAYPAEFFRSTYIPMQQDEAVWRRVENQYHFRTIFFWRHDLTPWAQRFLATRRTDPQWTLTYQDDYSMIFQRVESNP